MKTLKLLLILECKKTLQNQIISLKQLLKDVTESVNNETKSSVGDKHETSRAIMQLEQEKLGKQLLVAETQLTEFEKINFEIPIKQLTQGHLIETDKGYFLIAVSIGKMIIDNKSVFVISQNSPLGKAFNGMSINNVITFNEAIYRIKKIA